MLERYSPLTTDIVDNYSTVAINGTGYVNAGITWSLVAEVITMGIVSTCIVLSNVVNLTVLGFLKTSMTWATRLFLINLSVSDLLVGVIACAPSVAAAVSGRWIYGETWCQVSGVTHGTSVTISIWSISMVGLNRYAATALPIGYRKLVTRSWRYYVVIAVLWTAALATFTAPLFTKHDMIYYRYSESQKMCGLHWEYPIFAIATGFYIPILSGVVLIFTGLGINSTLRRRIPATAIGNPAQAMSLITVPDRIDSGCFRLRRRDMETSSAVNHHEDDVPVEDSHIVDAVAVTNIGYSRTKPLPVPTAEALSAVTQIGGSRHRWNRGSRRTLRILIFTGIAYFICWGPYTTLVFVKCFAPSLLFPPAIEFFFMWLANANSGVNVFIYSSTNAAFRRQSLRLARYLCCCRCNNPDAQRAVLAVGRLVTVERAAGVSNRLLPSEASRCRSGIDAQV